MISSLGQTVIDVLALAGVTAYILLSIRYIFVMWCMRHSFFVALRSPLLACGTGLCLAFRCWTTTLEYVVAWGDRIPTDDGIVDLLSLPAFVVAELMMIARAIRVLLMYFPQKRKAWGRIPKEKTIISIMASAYVLMEIAVWSAAALYGIPWAAKLVDIMVAALVLLTAPAAGLCLGSQLSKVDDMCHVGRELSQVGVAVTIGAFYYVAVLTVPMSTLAFKYAHVAMGAVIYTPTLWIVNIKPIRDIIRKEDHVRSKPGGYQLLYGTIPWRTTSKKSVRVVVRAGETVTSLAANSTTDKNAVDDIMGFAPLRDVFGEFCRKALCSESFNFLVDVSEYKSSVYSVVDHHSGVKAPAVGEDFRKYVAIVKEYIEPNSCSEVNIDSRTRNEALQYMEQHEFISLSLDRRADVFHLAERDVIRMLKDNLLNKFRASTPYKELVGNEMLREE